MTPKIGIALLSALLSLSACGQSQTSSSGPVGTLNGSAPPGRGSTAAATLSGVLGGAGAGRLDSGDRMAAAKAVARVQTAPIGQQVTWNNPDSGNSGTIVAIREGYAASGAYCREFQQTVTTGGAPQQSYGKACQQPDGSWKTVQ